MRKSFIALVFLMLLAPFTLVNAQGNKALQKDNTKPSGMGMPSDVQGCMQQIAADSTMRMEMVSRIMNNMKGDSTAMNQFCRKIMGNAEVHKAMMQMMQNQEMNDTGGMGGMIKKDVRDEVKRNSSDTVSIHQ